MYAPILLLLSSTVHPFKCITQMCRLSCQLHIFSALYASHWIIQNDNYWKISRLFDLISINHSLCDFGFQTKHRWVKMSQCLDSDRLFGLLSPKQPIKVNTLAR